MRWSRGWLCGLSLTSVALAPAGVAEPSPRERVITSAIAQVGRTVRYDPAYTAIPYPAGDVPIEKGVCTDVVIRAFRSVGVDFQVLVHEDMRKAFSAYPKRWGLRRADRNIDHRRVLNLATFLTRAGKRVPVTATESAYRPGDLVTWDLRGNGSLPHIGIVTDRPVRGTDRMHIVHNIGAGTRVEDILFSYPITGHFRWFG